MNCKQNNDILKFIGIETRAAVGLFILFIYICVCVWPTELVWLEYGK